MREDPGMAADSKVPERRGPERDGPGGGGPGRGWSGPRATAGGAVTLEPGVAAGRPTLRGAVGVAVFAALTAVAARFAVPVPGTAVPFTLQPVAVLLAGLLLGPRLGAASQAAYVAAGAGGLPVFAAGGGIAYLLGPTGGYLLAFPAGAAVAGLVARRGGIPRQAAGAVLGLAAVHAGGILWLALLAGAPEALRRGLAPFVLGDLLKVALAVTAAAGLRGRVSRLLTGR